MERSSKHRGWNYMRRNAVLWSLWCIINDSSLYLYYHETIFLHSLWDCFPHASPKSSGPTHKSRHQCTADCGFVYNTSGDWHFSSSHHSILITDVTLLKTVAALFLLNGHFQSKHFGKKRVHRFHFSHRSFSSLGRELQQISWITNHVCHVCPDLGSLWVRSDSHWKHHCLHLEMGQFQQLVSTWRHILVRSK